MIIIIAFDSRNIRRGDIHLFLRAVELLCQGKPPKNIILKLQKTTRDLDFLKNQFPKLIEVLLPLALNRVLNEDHLVWGYTSRGQDTFIRIGEVK